MAWILLRPSNYKQVAPLVRTGGSRHAGLAALQHRNIQPVGCTGRQLHFANDANHFSGEMNHPSGWLIHSIFDYFA